MARFRQFIDALLAQTQEKVGLIFAGLDGYPVDVILRQPSSNAAVIADLQGRGDPHGLVPELSRRGDEFPPDAPMADVWPRFFERSATDPANGTVSIATTAEWERLSQEILALQQIPNPTPLQQAQLLVKTEALQDVERLLKGSVRFTADIAQWAQYQVRAAASDLIAARAAGAVPPAVQARFDAAVKAGLGFFPSILVGSGPSRQRTPVRWAFADTPKPLGTLYVPDSEKSKSGYIPPARTSTNAHVRTDLSREGICRPVFALWDLYRATTDPAARADLADAALAVVEELRRNEFKAHYAPSSNVFFGKAAQARFDPRLAVARPFLALFPHLDQVDALFGGDAMFLYALLRIAGEMGLRAGATGPQAGRSYGEIADDFFAANRRTMEVSTTGLFFRFAGRTIREIVSGLLDVVADQAGGLLADLVFLYLLLLLLLLVLATFLPVLGGLFAFLALGLVLAPVVIGIVVFGIHGGKRLDLLVFRDLYHSIGLESDVLSLLLQLDQGRPGPMAFWETKMLQILALERRKVDALFQSYFAGTDVGRQALDTDLGALAVQVATLQQQMQQAASGLPGSAAQFAAAAAAYAAARQMLEFAYRIQHNVWRATPERLVRAHYGHSYERNLVAHNAGQDIGLVRGRIAELNARPYPLDLGRPATGLPAVSTGPIVIPSSFPLVNRISDFGDVARLLLGREPDTEQHREPADPEWWPNRTHVLSMSPYKFDGVTPGDIHWAAGELTLCLARLRELDRDLVGVVDQLNP